jgi:hypothetical protein
MSSRAARPLLLLCAAALLGAIAGRVASAQAVTSSDDSRPPKKVARLLGVFDRATGNPLSGAQVIDLLSQSYVMTPPDGTVGLHFLQVQHDSAVVWIRKLGYRDSSFVILARDTTVITVLLERVGVELAGVHVTADANLRGFGGLQARCGDFRGSCFTPDQIAERPASKVTEFIQKARGVKQNCARLGRTGSCEISMRKSAGPGRCAPDIFIDGHPWRSLGPPMEELDGFFSAQNVKGVEVYEGDLPKPAGFDSICGVILIWTK